MDSARHIENTDSDDGALISGHDSHDPTCHPTYTIGFNNQGSTQREVQPNYTEYDAFHVDEPSHHVHDEQASLDKKHTAQIDNVPNMHVESGQAEHPSDLVRSSEKIDSPNLRHHTIKSVKVPQSDNPEVPSHSISQPNKFPSRSLGYSGNVKAHTKNQGRPTANERSKMVAKKTNRQYSNPPNLRESTSEFTPGQLPATGPNDPFSQWYQMMSQYYNQYYPGYQLPQPPGSTTTPQSHTLTRSLEAKIPKHLSGLTGTVNKSVPIAQPFPTTMPTNSMDYAQYYYHYYYGAAAGQFLSGSNPYGLDLSGRKTPKFFPSPHVRASLSNSGTLLQILPTRPSDGELARIELIDICELANESVAEATRKASEVGLGLERDGYSSGTSGMESPSHLSSLQGPVPVGGDDEAGRETRAYLNIVNAWGRNEHIFYPGPLSRSGTLKADVLAFLREKLSEIQDRMPIDWESAGLLLAYLELLIKNNGVVQPSDLVNLLLEGHEPQTHELRVKYSSERHIGVSPNLNMNQRGYSLNPSDSMVSLDISQPTSGRQTPQHQSYAPIQVHGRPSSVKAASEAGIGFNSHNVLRNATGKLTREQQVTDAEDQAVDRFRELLMHGMTTKALEHACRTQLWGHAFLLSQRMGATVFDKVISRFTSRAISTEDPILTLYQLTAGEIPQAVNAAAYGRGSDNGEWRPHLAMMLAAESVHDELKRAALERLGDGLLSRRLIYAAHLCYLLIGPLVERSKSGRGQSTVYNLPEKIWLLGLPANNSSSIGVDPQQSSAFPSSGSTSLSVFSAANEAIQLTEIYEYAMKLANRDYRLPQLLPFKMVYATRLLDSGLLDKANQYLGMIGEDLLLDVVDVDVSNPLADGFTVLYSLIENCLRLTEPLQSHSDLDVFDVGVATPIVNMAAGGLPITKLASLKLKNNDWLDSLRQVYYQMNEALGNAKRQQFSASLNTHDPISPNQFAHCKPEEPVTPKPFTNYGSAPGYDTNITTTTNHAPNSLPPSHLSHQFDPRTQSDPSSDYSSSGQVASAYLVRNVPSQPIQLPASAQMDAVRPQHHAHDPTPVHPLANAASSIPNAYAGLDFNHGMQKMHPGHIPSNQSTHTYMAQSVGYDHNFQPLPLHTAHTHPTNNVPSSPYYPLPVDPSNTAHRSDEQAPNTSELISSHMYSSDSHTVVQQQQLPSEQAKPAGSFFVPAPVSSPIDNTTLGNSSGFDYFAGFQSIDQKSGNRSRTMSGCSQGSGRLTHSPDAHNTLPRSGGRNPPRIGLSNSMDRPMNSPKQFDFLQAPIKEEPKSNDDQLKTDEPSAEQPTKESWFSWLGKLKRNGSKNIHLPDDSKPSIIWDDQLKQWIDIDNPEANEPTPPPPPMMTDKPNPTGATRTSMPPSFGAGFPANYSAGGAGRSRYVNVLANQTTGSAASKIDAPLQPPLPPAVFSPHSGVGYRRADIQPPQVNSVTESTSTAYQRDGENIGLMIRQ